VSNFTSGMCTNSGHSGLRWIKSSLSLANGDCVEVASLTDGSIGVRDSKDSQGPILTFTASEWNAFVGGVRNGEFDGFGVVPSN
jgi:uncharacterized protein DUF397